MSPSRTVDVVTDVESERRRQITLWGDQSHPDGTFATDESRWQRDSDRSQTMVAMHYGTLTWRHILQEEVSEAFAEEDAHLLRAELIQVAAVAVAWVEDIDRKLAGAQ